MKSDRDRGLQVVVPYARAPHPLALESIQRFAPKAELIDVEGSDEAYYRLLAGRWAAGRPFAIIEQDIEISRGTIAALRRCTEPYCLFPYHGIDGAVNCTCPDPECPSLWKIALGCTRFSADLIAAVPDLFNIEQRKQHWRGLDSVIFNRLRDAGYSPHVHFPPVLHHHRYRNVCVCRTGHVEYPVDAEGRYKKGTP